MALPILILCNFVFYWVSCFIILNILLLNGIIYKLFLSKIFKKIIKILYIKTTKPKVNIKLVFSANMYINLLYVNNAQIIIITVANIGFKINVENFNFKFIIFFKIAKSIVTVIKWQITVAKLAPFTPS